MWSYNKESSGDWVCEACVLADLRQIQGGHENIGNSSDPNDLYINPRKIDVCKSKRAMASSKVKFLSTNDAIKLSSGSLRREALVKSGFDQRFNSSAGVPRFHNPRAKLNLGAKTSGAKSHEHDGPNFISRVDSKLCNVIEAYRSANVDMHVAMKLKDGDGMGTCMAVTKVLGAEQEVLPCGGKENICHNMASTCTGSFEDSKTTKANANTREIQKPNAVLDRNVAVRDASDPVHKEPSDEPHKDTKSSHSDAVKEIESTSLPPPSSLTSSSGGGALTTVEATYSGVDDIDTLTKFRLFSLFFPALNPAWKGSIELFDQSRNPKIYYGFKAQPACQIHQKAHDLLKTLPAKISVQLHSQSYIHGAFKNDLPDFRDIALYFFPVPEEERSKENYSIVFGLLEIQNSVLRCHINGAELLICTSKQLSPDSKDVIACAKMEHFLWGVFKSLSDEIHRNVTVNPEPNDCKDRSQYLKSGGEEHPNPSKVPFIQPPKASQPSSEDQARVPLMRALDIPKTEPTDHPSVPIVRASKTTHSDSDLPRVPPEFLPGYVPPLHTPKTPLSGPETPHQRAPSLRVSQTKEEPLPGFDVPKPGNNGPLPKVHEKHIESVTYENKTQPHEQCQDAPLKRPAMLTHWMPPPKNWVKLNVAWHARCHSLVGAGGILRDSCGYWVLGYVKKFNTQPSMATDFCVLYEGLRLVKEHTYNCVLVETESRLMLDLLNLARNAENYESRSPEVASCLQLLKEVWQWRVSFVQKHANRAANWLAAYSDNYPTGRKTLIERPPQKLISILSKDRVRP